MSVQSLSGQTIGQYELRELYGSGGMGAVYRAYQKILEREVAFKVLSIEMMTDDDYIKRFYQEAKTAAALEHPHIVPVYDFGTVGDINFVAMRLLTGGSLNERLKHKAGENVSLGETGELLKQLASALDYAHSKNVIHRDVKSNNVMFDNHGSAYLVDFGIAKLLNQNALTADGMVMGTPTHMAPEQWKGETPTHAIDQYALAVVIYQMLTKRMPFEAQTPYGLMTKHLNEMPTPPQSLRMDIPHAVAVVVERALAKDPQDRFPTVTAFSQAFAAAVSGSEGSSTQLFTFPLQRSKTSSATTIPSPPPTPPALDLSGPTYVQGREPSTDLEPTPPAKPIYTNPIVWVVGIVVLLVIGFFALQSGSSAANTNATETAQAVVQIASPETPAVVAAADTATSAPVVATQSQAELDVASTLAALNGLMTANAGATLNAPTSTPTATNTPTATATFTATFTSTPATPVASVRREISARTGPGAQYPIMMNLQANDTLDITGISVDGNWYQVILPDGAQGWVAASASLVTISGNVDVIPLAQAPTDIPTNTPTATSTATDTVTPSATPTATETVTPSSTPTATETVTPSATSTITNVPVGTASATPTITPTSTRVEISGPSPTPVNTTIVYGDTVSGVLGRNQVATYTFTGIAGQVVSVAADAQFDSLLQLYGRDNLALVEDDDSAGNQNPLINAFTLPQNGDYRIILRGYAASAQGSFRLSLVEGAYTVPVASGSVIDYYQTITGYLDRNQEPAYTFKGTQGDIVTISASAGFDSNLTLKGPDGTVLITNDDSANSINPMIEFFTLPTTGDYTIILRGYSADSLGTYELALSKGEANFDRTTPITYGSTFTGHLDAGAQVAFTFTGSSGDRISVTVQSNFDPNLLLRDDQGNLVTQDDDSGGRLQPALTDFRLPRTGTYVVIVDAFSETDQGDFTLTLSSR